MCNWEGIIHTNECDTEYRFKWIIEINQVIHIFIIVLLSFIEEQILKCF